MSGDFKRTLGSADDFGMFIRTYDNLEFRSKVCAGSYKPDNVTNAELDTYFSEMRFGHSFLEKYLPTGKLRILEIGAGLGILSTYLKRQGYDVVALEPSGLDYDLFAITKELIWAGDKATMPTLLDKKAEELDPESDGKFDFIFSINVMEHIDDIETATQNILACLKSDGICVNSCPNYLVPYEPHYAIPLIPFSSGLSRKCFASQINAHPETWDTLNFVNWYSVRRMARKNNATVTFEKGLIYQSFQRLGEDAEFMSRHKDGMVGGLYRFLSTTGLMRVLKYLPPALSTPMVFTYALR